MMDSTGSHCILRLAQQGLVEELKAALALSNGNPDATRNLVNHADAKGFTALHHAAYFDEGG